MEEIRREIRQLRRALYGDTEINQKGLYDKLDRVETRLDALIDGEVAALRIDYRIAIVYLKGIAGAVGTILVTVLIAVIVGYLRSVGAA